jgi:hypothetical protein
MPFVNGTKTVLTLRKYIDGQPTEETKANTLGDPDYIAPYLDTVSCPITNITTTSTTTTTSTSTTTTTVAPGTTTTTVAPGTTTTTEAPLRWNLVTCPGGSATSESIGYNDAGISWSIGDVVLADNGVCYEIASLSSGTPTLIGVSFFNNCTECGGSGGAP